MLLRRADHHEANDLKGVKGIDRYVIDGYTMPGWIGEAGAVTEDRFDPPVWQNTTAEDDHDDEDEYEEGSS